MQADFRVTIAEADPGGTTLSVPQRLAIALVRAYQLTLSPLFGGSCRFIPSCSAYAAEAVRIHGAARGTWLAARRLSRCHPFGSHGVDPVPARTRRA